MAEQALKTGTPLSRPAAAALILLCLCAACGRARTDERPKMPIVFSEEYDITLYGIQKLHPFDSEKYGKVARHLTDSTGLTVRSFHEPPMITERELLLVHTERYLKSLDDSRNVARIAELGLLRLFPSSVLRNRILKPMLRATGGTMLGARLALEQGWAINLSGGYHHAKPDGGEGFCFFADIPIAVKILHAEKPALRVMVIDLDAHQGNGIETCLGPDRRVRIFDMYNGDIYPRDEAARAHIAFDHPLRSGTDDREYLALLKKHLPAAVDRARPGIIFYNAGVDIFREDPLGRLALTEKGIIIRDEFVFRCALGRKIPILMVLSGGYTKKSSRIIRRSIVNILEKVIGLKR